MTRYQIYQSEYRGLNKEKCQGYCKKYWDKHKDKINEARRSKKWKERIDEAMAVHSIITSYRLQRIKREKSKTRKMVYEQLRKDIGLV